MEGIKIVARILLWLVAASVLGAAAFGFFAELRGEPVWQPLRIVNAAIFLVGWAIVAFKTAQVIFEITRLDDEGDFLT